MSTTVVDSSGQPIAHRSFVGPERGTVVQMECTREEWPDWASVEVREEGWTHSCTLSHWMEQQRGCEIVWDSAARQNDMARRLEDHRWSDSPSFREAALRCRTRARSIVRSTVRLVA